MGGELISSIIEKAIWLKDNNKHLILQPMTSEPELRSYLSQNGFSIKQEQAVKNGEHIYTVMQAEYDPKYVQTDVLFPYIGILKGNTPDNRAYIKRKCDCLQKRVNGLRQGGDNDNEANRLAEIIQRLKDML